MKTNEIDNTQTSERSANKDRQSDSKAVFFVFPEEQYAGTETGQQVTEWVYKCAVYKRHTNKKVRVYRKICIKCT